MEKDENSLLENSVSENGPESEESEQIKKESDLPEEIDDGEPSEASFNDGETGVIFGGESRGCGNEFNWYVAHVLTGHENKVKRSIRERIINHHLEDSFAKLYIPEEEIVKNVNGKKRRIKKKFFPGYVLIKMIMNDNTWHLVKNTDKVTGFLGANKNTPSPLPEEEARFLMGQAKDGFKKSKQGLNLSEGDNVKVTDGPFASFVGVVEHVSDKGKIRVQVSIFGRPTPVELDFSQVERV